MKKGRVSGAKFKLTLITSGTGTLSGGSVASAARLPAGTVVTVTATAGQGASFTGWSGDLTGSTNPTTITMTAAKTVTASFTPDPVQFTLAVSSGTGGHVTSNVGGIDTTATGQGTANFDSGTDVILTATTDSGYTFNGWSGSATGTTNPKTVTMTASKSVTANFVQNLTRTLTVAKAGDGGGEITGPGINTATADDSQAYSDGTAISLTALPDGSSTFTGWSGEDPWRGGPMSQALPGAYSDLATLDYSWFYNYSKSQGAYSGSVPFVPMVFNAANATGLSSLNGTSDDYLLGFNEPDAAGANHLTATQALDLWPNLMDTGRSLGSPANTTGATQWRSDFMSGAHTRGYRVDFMCVHWYSDGGTAQDLVNYLNNVWGNYGGNSNSPWFGTPIWLTEFDAYNGSQAQNATFAQNVGPLLANLPFLHRVGWYANRSIPGGAYANVGLCNSSGALTTVGANYKNWTDANPISVTMNVDKTITGTFTDGGGSGGNGGFAAIGAGTLSANAWYPTSIFKTPIASLSSAGQTVHSNSANIITSMFSRGPASTGGKHATIVGYTGLGNKAGADFSHPIYKAVSGDVTITLTTTNYHNTDLDGVTIKVPANAKWSNGSDASMGVLQPVDGNGDTWEIDFWGINTAQTNIAAGRITCGFARRNKLNTDGTNTTSANDRGGITAARFSHGLGVVRVDELTSNYGGGSLTTIDHALFVAVNSWHGRVFPSNTTGGTSGQISDVNAPAMGQHIRVKASYDVAGSGLPLWHKRIMKALQTYGAYVGDTGGASFNLQLESENPYLAAAVTPTCLNYLDTTTSHTPGTIYDIDAGVTWANILEVLNPPT